MDDLLKNIQSATAEILTNEVEAEPAEKPVLAQPVDIIQVQRDAQRDYAKKRFPKGARAQVNATVKDVIDGAGTSSLARAYERAKDDSETLDKMGDHMRAQIIRNQYMQEKFLPAVEIVVNFASPDELLNAEDALKTLDKYALGVGSMSGYTAAYVREAYKNSLGQDTQPSSPFVAHGIDRLNGLLDSDQMVLARGLAAKLKKKIDAGETIASQEDYDLISTVANS